MYIKEAHPEDGWKMPQNQKEGISVNQPLTLDERDSVATTCSTKLALTMPFVVDGINNKVGQAYAAWPDRLYIVGNDGKIAYKGEPGPGGFKAQEMSARLSDLLKGAGKDSKPGDKKDEKSK